MRAILRKISWLRLLLAWWIVILNWGIILGQTGTLIATAEAENGVFSGSVFKGTSFGGFTGTGYATNFINTGDKVTVSVTIPTKAFYAVYIRYHSEYKKQYVSINGASPSEVEFVNSGASWGTANAGKYIFNAGVNTITIEKSWGWCDIDHIKVYTTTLNNYDDITTQLNDTLATVATQSLYHYLHYQFRKRIISGQTDGAYYDTIKSITGKSPLYRTWDFMHYTEGYPYLWKNGGFTFGIDTNDKSTDNAIAWYKNTGKKGIVGFHWHWCSPSGGTVGTNTFYTSYTTFDVSKAVQQGTTEYNLIIRDIDAIAAQLKKLRDQGVPILWRPLHEAGGGWFWWGAKGPAACKQLWNIMYDRLMNYHKLHNLIWVWSSPEADWYPGNNTVDIIGFDSYPGDFNYSTQKNMFDQLHSVTQGKKIVAMSENGPIPNPDDCLDFDSPWLLFMSWADLVKSQNSRQHIIDVYANNRVLTLENDTFPMIITATGAALCDSGSATLYATSNFGAVKWYVAPTGDTAIYSGTSFTTPKIYQTTTYFVEASYNNKSGELKRIPVKATVYRRADSLSVSGLSAICKPASNILYTLPVDPNIVSYTWTIPSGATGSGSSHLLSVNYTNSAVSGYITVKGQNVCGDGPVDSLAISVNSIPSTPVITQFMDTIRSSSVLGNHWYYNSNIIPYAVYDTIVFPKSGTYYTIVTINGCSSLPSNSITAYRTGIMPSGSKNDFMVYPNPTRGKVTLVFQDKLPVDTQISVYNQSGNLIKTVQINKRDRKAEVDLGNMAPGLYVFSVNSKIKSCVIKE